MALFYLNKEDILLPIAIQLYQEKSDTNPLFVPNDPYYTWLLVKMWFNNADAVYQRACLLTSKYNLGKLKKNSLLRKCGLFFITKELFCFLFVTAATHWVLELITVAMNRQLSPSHPIYRLLAPYLRLVLAINQ